MTKIQNFIQRLNSYDDQDVKVALLKKLDPLLAARLIEEGGEIRISITQGNYQIIGCTEELAQTIMAVLANR